MALTVFVIGVEWNAVAHGVALSENATQVLTAAFSGIIGGLAGFMGGRASNRPPS